MMWMILELLKLLYLWNAELTLLHLLNRQNEILLRMPVMRVVYRLTILLKLVWSVVLVVGIARIAVIAPVVISRATVSVVPVISVVSVVVVIGARAEVIVVLSSAQHIAQYGAAGHHADHPHYVFCRPHIRRPLTVALFAVHRLAVLR